MVYPTSTAAPWRTVCSAPTDITAVVDYQWPYKNTLIVTPQSSVSISLLSSPSPAGDIAARNILLTSDMQCCIGDFDLAAWDGSVLQPCAKTMATRWCSPEVGRVAKERCLQPPIIA